MSRYDIAQDTPGPYTREQLIDIAQRAVVPVELWRNRDSAGAQRQVGLAIAWLRAGCEYDYSSGPYTVTGEDTIWLDLRVPGFEAFEWGTDDRGYWEEETVYLPTPARLGARVGGDWY